MANSSSSKTQLDRFKEAARELETDDDEARFNKKLGKLVKPKPDAKKND
ncbi:hypothetical protein [Sulfitobacter guttiformis]|uniref:Uncharacterized protein n=1 Tax=Sulfitobacter guttiformis TaxID=74349 RepID=J7FWJ0_9RHOB|nr:hypothetical protein [Sulfitobacter guttiformis]AFP55473.1 conserved hypothetical protein [Sulfitobacter guttiformis]KIN75513.1 hypothetical protein Z949_143 [Sulfitobacter guttiformis KCTC 32187]RKE92095.1 hypothetical protein C8N30_3852 [Sulfitobacter guttiformis]